MIAPDIASVRLQILEVRQDPQLVDDPCVLMAVDDEHTDPRGPFRGAERRRLSLAVCGSDRYHRCISAQDGFQVEPHSTCGHITSLRLDTERSLEDGHEWFRQVGPEVRGADP